MADIDLDLTGIKVIEEKLKELEDDIDNPITWYAGTNVFYSVYLEFGTSKMDPRPAFRPALNEARANPDQFIRQNTNTTPSEIDNVNEYIRALAFAFERRIKEIITVKNIIDTGTYRASIVAVPTDPSDLPTVEDFDGDNIPPDAGRQMVSREIEIDT